LDWLRIELHNLFWFHSYRVIMFSWFGLWIWQVNLSSPNWSKMLFFFFFYIYIYILKNFLNFDEPNNFFTGYWVVFGPNKSIRSYWVDHHMVKFFYKKNINNAWMFLLYVPKKINLTYSVAQVNDLIKMY
jgi:hypothetical protein